MEQNLQSFPGIRTESQQSSAITYPNQFPFINAGHCLPSHHLGGSLSSFTPFLCQSIHPSSQQQSHLPGPSGLPQG